MQMDRHARRDLKGNNWNGWGYSPEENHANRVMQVNFWLDAIKEDLIDYPTQQDIFTAKVLERWLAVFS